MSAVDVHDPPDAGGTCSGSVRRRRTGATFGPLALLVVLAVAVAVAACGSVTDTGSVRDGTLAAVQVPVNDGLFPAVVSVSVTMHDDGTWKFDTTLSSPYDTADRYADAWRIRSLAPADDADEPTVFGVRELLHDHADEQPFTRSLSGVEIPVDVRTVVVEGRDSMNGWGGELVEVDLPDRG